MEAIRSTLFAAYNSCPAKAKYMQEQRIENNMFDFGTCVHKVLSLVPNILLSDDENSIDQLIIDEIVAKMNYCDVTLLQRAKSCIDVGVTNIKQALIDGFTIETEVPLKRTLPNGVLVTGTADRIDSNKKMFRIIDYKSGYRAPTRDDMLGDMQLLTYAYLSQDRASMAQAVSIGLFSLGRDFLQELEIPVDIECIIEDVLNARADRMLSDKVWRANPSKQCGYCDFFNKCEFWKTYKDWTTIPDSLDEQVRLLEEVIDYSSGLKEIGDTLKELIVANMEQQGLETITIGGKERNLSQNISNRGGKIVVTKPFIRI
jgi:CRISPR/Cas system-associated exonuclease Cas4 (RecB family)